MSNGTWRARLVSNLSNWLVQEGPLEQVGCECCTELNCTTDNYHVCTRRLEAYEIAKLSRKCDVPPESTVRIRQRVRSSDGRNGTED